MLDLFGKGYVVEHCIAFLQRQRKQEELMFYVTDALMYITQNTANMAGGKSIAKRYYELLNPEPEETRTAQDIIDSIRSKLGE